MSSFPNSPQLLKGGIVLLDSSSGRILRIIALQYNPDSLTRSLQIQSVPGDSKDRAEVLRLIGPPVETIKLDAEIDATDQLEFPEKNPNTAQAGIFPQLAALETIIYPPSQQLVSNNNLASQGTLEIAPMESPLTLFIWSSRRIVPVRITDFSVTEEAFDAFLNPVRAKVSISMRVLSVTDLGFEHRGGNLFLAYQKQKERLASLSTQGTFAALGITGIS
jgi:hypothetical protein